jgi:hypothetical protein
MVIEAEILAKDRERRRRFAEILVGERERRVGDVKMLA